MRDELTALLARCPRCRASYDDNVALLIAEDEGVLTDEQVVAVLDHLRKQHREKHVS